MIDSSVSLNLEKSSMASCEIGKLKIRQLQETFIGDSSRALNINKFSFWCGNLRSVSVDIRSVLSIVQKVTKKGNEPL